MNMRQIEEQKSSLFTNILAFFFLLSAFGLGYYYWHPSLKIKNKTSSSIPQEINLESSKESELKNLSPEETVQQFSQRFFEILADPENQQSIEEAYFLLSTAGRQSISYFESSSSALASFCSVQAPPPNKEVVVKSVSQIQDKATVEAVWQYSSPISKYFNLVLENGIWKIDFISR